MAKHPKQLNLDEVTGQIKGLSSADQMRTLTNIKELIDSRKKELEGKKKEADDELLILSNNGKQ